MDNTCLDCAHAEWKHVASGKRNKRKSGICRWETPEYGLPLSIITHTIHVVVCTITLDHPYVNCPAWTAHEDTTEGVVYHQCDEAKKHNVWYECRQYYNGFKDYSCHGSHSNNEIWCVKSLRETHNCHYCRIPFRNDAIWKDHMEINSNEQ